MKSSHIIFLFILLSVMPLYGKTDTETARKLGKLEQGKVTRNNHNGSPYETKSPITTEDKWSFTPSEH